MSEDRAGPLAISAPLDRGVDTAGTDMATNKTKRAA